jgi:hypothetical protein
VAVAVAVAGYSPAVVDLLARVVAVLALMAQMEEVVAGVADIPELALVVAVAGVRLAAMLALALVAALVVKLLHSIVKQSHGLAATQQGFTGVFHERHNNH